VRALAIALLAACGHGDEPEMSCGDGVVDPGEVCDDGNQLSNDGCSAVCDLESRAVVRWAFYPNIGQDLAGCPADVAEIEVLVDSGDEKRFPCSAPFGEIAVANRAQRVFARALDANGNVLAATPPRFLPSDFRVTVAFYGDAGFTRVFIPRQGDNCSSVTALYMSLHLVGGPPGPGLAKTFYCGEDQDARDGVLLSDPLPAGTYDLTIRGNGIDRARNGVVIGTNNAITDVDFTTP
jgi:cysteine-rich repeat protein